MRRPARAARALPAVLAVALAACLAAPAAAQVAVRFVAPEGYADAESRWGSGPTLRVTLAEIRRLLVEEGARVLRPDTSLAVEVLDIDLAGIDRPGLPTGPRLVTDITPPRLRLRYTLRQGRRTVLAAEEALTEIDVLTRDARTSLGAGSFGYERVLIRDWLRDRILPRLTARG